MGASPLGFRGHFFFLTDAWNKGIKFRLRHFCWFISSPWGAASDQGLPGHSQPDVRGALVASLALMGKPRAHKGSQLLIVYSLQVPCKEIEY